MLVIEWPAPTTEHRFHRQISLLKQSSRTEPARTFLPSRFIAAHSTPVALREGVLYVRVLQPSLHFELEQIAKTEILRKLKRRFGAKPFATFVFGLDELGRAKPPLLGLSLTRCILTLYYGCQSLKRAIYENMPYPESLFNSVFADGMRTR